MKVLKRESKGIKTKATAFNITNFSNMSSKIRQSLIYTLNSSLTGSKIFKVLWNPSNSWFSVSWKIILMQYFKLTVSLKKDTVCMPLAKYLTWEVGNKYFLLLLLFSNPNPNCNFNPNPIPKTEADPNPYPKLKLTIILI